MGPAPSKKLFPISQSPAGTQSCSMRAPWSHPSFFAELFTAYCPVFSLRPGLYLLLLRPPPKTGAAMYKVDLNILKTPLFPTLLMPLFPHRLILQYFYFVLPLIFCFSHPYLLSYSFLVILLYRNISIFSFILYISTLKY